MLLQLPEFGYPSDFELPTVKTKGETRSVAGLTVSLKYRQVSSPVEQFLMGTLIGAPDTRRVCIGVPVRWVDSQVWALRPTEGADAAPPSHPSTWLFVVLRGEVSGSAGARAAGLPKP